MNIKIRTKLSAITIMVLMIWFASCKKADINFGEEFLVDDGLQVYKTDSFGVDVSTVYLDSFITSNKGTILVGNYADPLFGKIAASSYFEIFPPGVIGDFTNTTLDSICLVLKPNIGNYYGDSTKPFNIIVQELADSIYLPENVFHFYNHSKFTAKTISPLADKTFSFLPLSTNEMIVKLDNTKGTELLNKLKNTTDNTLKSSAAFLQYFKGIKLSSSNLSDMVIGFSDVVVMRLYYKTNDILPTHKYIDFTLGKKANQFNNITINRSGSAIENIKTNKEIASTITNNAAFTQAATGSMIKLTFPSIKEILKIPNFAKVLKASLIVRPVAVTYSSTYFLPPALRLSITDLNNKIGDDLAYVTNNGTLSVQMGFLQTDYFLQQKTQYQYDLTEYVKNVLRTQSIIPGDGLLLTPPSPSFENELARVVIGNKNNLLGKIELQIYYAAVK
jgi:hypothetical protein